MTTYAEHFHVSPFGKTITRDEVAETLGFLDDWEARYRYVIELGQQLPPMPEALKTQANIVRGCQSPVWLAVLQDGENIYYLIDSDAHIVRGLAAMVLSAYNGCSALEIQHFDIEAWFDSLDLVNHLSPTRGNGLRAMVQRMVEAAAEQPGESE